MTLSFLSPSVACNVPGQARRIVRLISDRLLRFGIGIALAGVFTTPAWAQEVRIPYNCESIRLEDKLALDKAFGGGIDVCQQVKAGMLEPGETYNLSAKPNVFNRELFRWIEQLNKDERTGSLSYEEIIQWNKVEDAFEDLRKWAKRRRQGQPQ